MVFINKSINDPIFVVKNGVLQKYTGFGGDVVIPNSVTSIGYRAFYGCSSLASVTIPDSVTSIGDLAFMHSGLTSITIPDSVTSIGNSAFSDCSSLTSITIPKSVTYIGQKAFSNCSSLKTLPMVQPMCVDDAVKILRDKIIAEITKDPSVSYQLASLPWRDAASCFTEGHYKWDGAFFQLDLIHKKLGAKVEVYLDRVGSVSDFISLSASEFHQIAKRHDMNSVLQAFQSDEDWAMLFDESLDEAISSACTALQKQQEEGK